MKVTILMLVAVLAAIIIVPLLIAAVRNHSTWFNTKLHRRQLRRVALANDNLALECRRENTRLKADVAVARYLLVRSGSDLEHAALCGANQAPLGNSDDSPGAAEDPFTVQLFGLGPCERIVIASEAIAVNADIYTAANGKVQDTPVAPGTYYLVGRATQAAAGDGDKFRIIPCFPVKVVIP